MYSKKKLKRIWDAVPPNYYQKGVKTNPLQRLWHYGKVSTILSFIPHTPSRILDVGCASGWFLSQVHTRFPESTCIGVDVYDKAIAYGKKLYPFLELRVADGHKLPVKNNSCDVVICAEVLEHVVDPKKVLAEIKRVLSPKGVAIIEMDTGNWLFRSVWHVWTHKLHGVWEDAHIQVYNEKRLEQEIRESEFNITSKKIFNATMAVAFQAKKKSLD